MSKTDFFRDFLLENIRKEIGVAKIKTCKNCGKNFNSFLQGDFCKIQCEIEYDKEIEKREERDI